MSRALLSEHCIGEESGHGRGRAVSSLVVVSRIEQTWKGHRVDEWEVGTCTRGNQSQTRQLDGQELHYVFPCRRRPHQLPTGWDRTPLEQFGARRCRLDLFHTSPHHLIPSHPIPSQPSPAQSRWDKAKPPSVAPIVVLSASNSPMCPEMGRLLARSKPNASHHIVMILVSSLSSPSHHRSGERKKQR